MAKNYSQAIKDPQELNIVAKDDYAKAGITHAVFDAVFFSFPQAKAIC